MPSRACIASKIHKNTMELIEFQCPPGHVLLRSIRTLDILRTKGFNALPGMYCFPDR